MVISDSPVLGGYFIFMITVTSEFFFKKKLKKEVHNYRTVGYPVFERKKKKKEKKKEGENLRTGHFRPTSVVGWVFDFVDNHEYFRIFSESHRVVT